MDWCSLGGWICVAAGGALVGLAIWWVRAVHFATRFVRKHFSYNSYSMRLWDSKVVKPEHVDRWPDRYRLSALEARVAALEPQPKKKAK